MSSGGRLDVGLRGEGYLIVNQGGEVNNSVGVIAKEPGARGYALVTGADSLWDNRQSLTLASESNTAGVLVINNGGTVRVNNGQGTLTIAEKAGSTGVLNIGAMSPQGADYGLHADVKNYLGGSDTDGAARAPGTLDAAFVRFGEGAGTVNFKHTGNEALDYRFQAGFVGLGTVNHFAGFTVLDGDSSGFTGPAHVHGGTMVANNVLAGNVTVHSGGTLRIGHEGPNDAGTTGHVVNDIVNNGVMQFNRSNIYTYGQVISGTGAVEQIGTGRTILTGANTYTGATTILRGTLQLGDGGTTGSIDATSGVDIRTDGTLAFNRSDVKIFDRQITGTGTIRQIGTGVTRLTANNAGFTGRRFVDAGTLSVNGILGGTVDVNTGGTLEGLGQVGSTIVHAGGTIAPGNATEPGRTPIGTLTIAGNFTQEAGSLYQTELRSTGESDLIRITGTATIAPGAILNVTKVDPARYELEHRYTVLTAGAGRTGTYTLTGDTWVSTFYRVEDHYDANNVYLDVAQHRLFQEAGWTVNQINAATAAQELKWQRDPVTNYPTNALFRAIAYLQSDEDARYAFDQISGEIYASTKAGLLEESRFIREATGNRLRGTLGGLGRKVPVQEPSRNIKDPMPRTISASLTEGPVLWGAGLRDVEQHRRRRQRGGSRPQPRRVLHRCGRSGRGKVPHRPRRRLQPVPVQRQRAPFAGNERQLPRRPVWRGGMEPAPVAARRQLHLARHLDHARRALSRFLGEPRLGLRCQHAAGLWRSRLRDLLERAEAGAFRRPRLCQAGGGRLSREGRRRCAGGRRRVFRQALRDPRPAARAPVRSARHGADRPWHARLAARLRQHDPQRRPCL